MFLCGSKQKGVGSSVSGDVAPRDICISVFFPLCNDTGTQKLVCHIKQGRLKIKSILREEV